jgi:hypothetical protein
MTRDGNSAVPRFLMSGDQAFLIPLKAAFRAGAISPGRK